MIISRKGNSPVDKYITSAEISKNLVVGKHYEVNKKDQKIELTPAGYKYAEQILGKGLFELNDPWAFYVINAGTHLLTHSLTYLLTYSLTHSLTHLPTHLLTYPLIHPPTHLGGDPRSDGAADNIHYKSGYSGDFECENVYSRCCESGVW